MTPPKNQILPLESIQWAVAAWPPGTLLGAATYWVPVTPAGLMVLLPLIHVQVPGGGTVPVPVRAMLCGEVEALSVSTSVAVYVATEVGLKKTVTVQLERPASEVPQLLVWVK